MKYSLVLQSLIVAFSSAQVVIDDRSNFFSNLSTRWSYSVGDLAPAVSYLPLSAGWIHVQSSLNQPGETDVFRFRSLANMPVSITSNSTIDLLCQIHTSSALPVLIRSDDNSDGNGQFSVSFDTTEWTSYLISVRAAPTSNSSVGNYSFRISAPAIDDYGNDVSDGFRISLTNSTLYASLYATDSGVFVFQTNRSGIFRAFTSSSLDTFGQLWGSDPQRDIQNSRLTMDDDSGASSNFDLSYQLTAYQTFWLIVYGYFGTTSGPYNVTIIWHPFPFSGIDLASSLGTVSVIPVARPYVPVNASGMISIPAEEDFFSFQVDFIGSFTVTISGPIRTNFSLFDSSRRLLAINSISIVNTTQFNCSVTAPGTLFYLGIRGATTNTTGPYSLVISTTAQDDYGNDLTGAYDISPMNGVRILSGSLDTPTDSDVFKIVAAADGFFTATSDATIFLHPILYNQTRNLATAKSYTSWNFYLPYWMQKGETYYLQVNSLYRQIGQYRLIFTFEASAIPVLSSSELAKATTSNFAILTSGKNTALTSSSVSSTELVIENSSSDFLQSETGLAIITLVVVLLALIFVSLVSLILLKRYKARQWQQDSSTLINTVHTAYSSTGIAIPVSMGQFVAISQVRRLYQLYEIGVTLDQLRSMGLPDLHERGFTPEECLQIRRELEMHGLLRH